MRLSGKPRTATLGEVRITKTEDTAIIAFRNVSAPTTHLKIGLEVADLTDEQILEIYNQGIIGSELLAEREFVATEIPLGKPQIEYFAPGDQWTPRGHVLRCSIEDGPDGETTIQIDEHELSMEEFRRLLSTFAGWAMRITFVSEVTDEQPKIVVREPEDDDAGLSADTARL